MRGSDYRKNLRVIIAGCGVLLLLLGLALLLYCGAAAWAYRDLPVETVQQRYYPDAVSVVNIDGVSLRYMEQGQGPALLLLHSHYFSMTMWDDWVTPLSRYFRVIRFDMTSHGLTGADPSGDYSMARSQQLLDGLLAHLQVDRVSLVGSSLGGNMAFTFAANNPHRVERLILINSGGLKHSGNRSGRVPGWVDAVLYLLPRFAFEYFLKWMMVDDTLVSEALIEEFHNSWRREGNRSAEMQRIRGFVRGDTAGDLAKIKAPVLLLWGRKNPQLPHALAGEFQQALTQSPQVQVNVYEGVGHVIPLEIPAQGVRDALLFLRADADQKKAAVTASLSALVPAGAQR